MNIIDMFKTIKKYELVNDSGEVQTFKYPPIKESLAKVESHHVRTTEGILWWAAGNKITSLPSARTLFHRSPNKFQGVLDSELIAEIILAEWEGCNTGTLCTETRERLVELFEVKLIGKNGGNDYAKIWGLQSLGYNVHAGEKDSFGWLSGVVPLYCGETIVYG